MTSVMGDRSKLSGFADQSLSKMLVTPIDLDVDCIGVAEVSGKADGELSVRSDDSRSWSTATRSECDGVDKVLPPVACPVQMIDGLVLRGLSVKEACEIVNGYFECYKRFADVALAGSSEVEVCSGGVEPVPLPSSRSSRRRARREAYKKTCELMVKDDGMCYLKVVLWSKRVRVSRDLGPRPTFHRLLSVLREGDLDPNAIRTHRVVCVSDKPGAHAYHITETVLEGDVDVGSFCDVVAAIVSVLPNAMGYKYEFVADRVVPVVPLVAKVGGRWFWQKKSAALPSPVSSSSSLSSDEDVSREAIPKREPTQSELDATALACRCISDELPGGGYGVGYCYLFAVHPCRRIDTGLTLGRFPLLSDVAIYLRTFGVDNTEILGIQFVGEHLCHIQREGISVLGVDGSIFYNKVLQMLERDPLVRVGATQEQLASFGLKSVKDVSEYEDHIQALRSPYVDVAVVRASCAEDDGVCTIVTENVRPTAIMNIDVHGVPSGGMWFRLTGRQMAWTKKGWFKGECVFKLPKDGVFSILHDGSDQAVTSLGWFGKSYVSEVTLPVLDGAENRKGFCDVCGFVVKLENHSLRCRKPVMSAEGVRLLARKAWLGDAQHRLDVRSFLLLSGVPDNERGIAEQRYVEHGAQAAWYRAYDGDKETAAGTSDRSLSTAFEASYVGAFRSSYVSDKLVLNGTAVAIGGLMEFLTGLVVK